MRECVVLETARLERLYRPDDADRAAMNPATLHCQAAIEILEPTAYQFQRQHIQQRDADANGAELDIKDCHCSSEEEEGYEIQRVCRESTRKQSGDLLVGSHPTGNIPGMALSEELERQRQYVPQEPAHHRDHHFRLEP